MIAYFHGNPRDETQCGQQVARQIELGAGEFQEAHYICDVHGDLNADGRAVNVWQEFITKDSRLTKWVKPSPPYPRPWDRRASLRPLAWFLAGVVLGLILGAFVGSALSSNVGSIRRFPSQVISDWGNTASGVNDLGGSAVPTDERIRPIARGKLSIPDIIREAAAEFDVDPAVMLRRAFCESRYNESAVGRAQEVGIFQFLPSTWMAYAPRLGYSLREIGHVEAQARVAAYMESMGEGRQWSCR